MEQLRGASSKGIGRALLMSAATRESGPHLLAFEAGRFNAEVALRSAESQPPVLCPSKSSLQEEVGQWQSYNTRLGVQGDLEAPRGGPTRALLDSKCKTNLDLLEDTRELRAQYDQEFADVSYECDGLQARFSNCDIRIEVFCKSLRLVCERL